MVVGDEGFIERCGCSLCGVIHRLLQKLVDIREDGIMAMEVSQILGQRRGTMRRSSGHEVRFREIVEDV